MEKWNIAKSAELYGIDNWGAGYFGINPAGHVSVRPTRSGGPELDLCEIVRAVEARGIELPLLIRFEGIIRSRVAHLREAFNTAIKEFEYKGRYQLTYPVKVNQQRHVVDAIRSAANHSGIGLEVGSKPELLAMLAIHDQPQGLLLCNGYKDAQFIELAMLARKLNRRSIIIVEQPYEIETLLRVSQELGIEPEIGLRMKPATRGTGRWGESGGEGAKFGLNSYELVHALETLGKHAKLHWVKLLHFHIGSQITSIVAIRKVLKEACRLYAELAKSCPQLSMFDVGGGLGVDYDGSRTNFESSMNYSMEEYARDVVWEVLSVCNQAGIEHPDIITESGRAVVAHHAVLITEVMDVAPALDAPAQAEPPPSDHPLLKELFCLFSETTLKTCHESLNDALTLREDVLSRFVQGDLSLHERAYADRMLKYVFSKISSLAVELKYVPEDLDKIEERLRDTYFCNFSLFQSLPDSWAINQLFPVMPIHRLKEEPTRSAMIADVTCDSDGKIDRFIDLKSVKRSLRLHPFNSAEPYYLGTFLVGAYQEILGDLHNLFGDTHAVHVETDEEGRFVIKDVIEGDSVHEVLRYVQFEQADLLNRLRSSIERSLREGTLTPQESAQLQKRFKEGLEGYTYLQW